MPRAKSVLEALPPCAVALLSFGPPPPLRFARGGDGWLEASALWEAALDGRRDVLERTWRTHEAQIRAAAGARTPWIVTWLGRRVAAAEEFDDE